MTDFRFTVEDTAAWAATRVDPTYGVALRRGTLELALYLPPGRDDQKPHEQDEVYVVVSGSGRFVSDGVETDFGPGDALFVPAGVEHRFVEHSEDTRVWVLFYGPPGGEAAEP